MVGEFGSCSGVITAKRKSKKFKLKKLIRKGLGTLISGMIFGVGCVIVERVDNWSQGEDTSEKMSVNHIPTKELARSDH